VTPQCKPEVTQAVREANGVGSSQSGNLPGSPNGSLSRLPSRLARARDISLGVKLLVLVVAAVLVVSSSGGGWYWFHSLATNRTDILTAPVKKGKLAITVKERGMLESAENNDVTCRVKARTQNATVARQVRARQTDRFHGNQP
jgi:hypothetical protein